MFAFVTSEFWRVLSTSTEVFLPACESELVHVCGLLEPFIAQGGLSKNATHPLSHSLMIGLVCHHCGQVRLVRKLSTFPDLMGLARVKMHGHMMPLELQSEMLELRTDYVEIGCQNWNIQTHVQ